MQLLLANNANINVQGGAEKMTVLHEAVLNETADEALIKFLLENGADPHLKYVRSLSPRVVSLLSAASRNKNGKSALDLAANSKFVSLFEKVHCVHPPHDDAPIAPPRRRARTTSSSNVLFFTGFDKARKESLTKSVQSLFGRRCVATTKTVENNGTTLPLASIHVHAPFSF